MLVCFGQRQHNSCLCLTTNYQLLSIGISWQNYGQVAVYLCFSMTALRPDSEAPVKRSTSYETKKRKESSQRSSSPVGKPLQHLSHPLAQVSSAGCAPLVSNDKWQLTLIQFTQCRNFNILTFPFLKSTKVGIESTLYASAVSYHCKKTLFSS